VGPFREAGLHGLRESWLVNGPDELEMEVELKYQLNHFVFQTSPFTSYHA
jgi:hypothetical protein